MLSFDFSRSMSEEIKPPNIDQVPDFRRFQKLKDAHRKINRKAIVSYVSLNKRLSFPKLRALYITNKEP